MQEHLARIDSTMFGYEDHGRVTFMLTVSYEGGGGQSIGTYCLSETEKEEGTYGVTQKGTAFGMEMLIRVLDAVGVRTWEELKGRYIWVLTTDHFGIGSGSSDVLGIRGTFGKKTIIFDDVRKEFLNV